MIIAGPGSGKTSTMVGRVLMLLNEGISPLNFSFIFPKELTISTFHPFSLQLCRSHAEKIGRTSEFLIYGQGQQRNAVIEAIRLLENGNNRSKDGTSLVGEESKGVVTPKQFKDKAKKWQKFVTQAKASGRTSADYCELGNWIGAMQLLQLQLSSLYQSKWRRKRRSYFRSKCYKWRRRSCFSCSCLQSKCCQGRDEFGNCCILPKFCTCSCPSCPSIDSNEYIWWKANARETKEELIDREPKFMD